MTPHETPYETQRLEKLFRQAMVEFLTMTFEDGRLIDEQTGDVQASDAFQFLKQRVNLPDADILEVVMRAENSWYER